jgi:dCTP deaminase
MSCLIKGVTSLAQWVDCTTAYVADVTGFGSIRERVKAGNVLFPLRKTQRRDSFASGIEDKFLEIHSGDCHWRGGSVESLRNTAKSKTDTNVSSMRRPHRSGMSIQSDRWIREQALKHRMIEPFSEKQVREGVISYGLSSYGYDLRVSDEFKIFTNVNSAIIDPKAFDERSFVSVQAESVIVPPNSFALARSIEYFRIPRDVLTICVGKSTYARCGIIVNVTPFEPEWEGFVTLEISNTTPLPAKVYANEGLCQILFFRSDQTCEVSYADRKGKYQNQQGIVLPKL